MAQDKEYFDPITGGSIPGGFIPDPSGSGNFIQGPGATQGAYTGAVYRPGGSIGYTIDPTHADAASKYGLKVGDVIDPTHAGFGSIFPTQKESGFDKFLGVALPALIAGGAGLGLAGAAGVGPAAAQTGVNAATAAPLDLAGPLAAPSSVSSFLSTVPEAIPGTTLPIGGAALDITAPGAVEAATAAGNALGPASGAPSLLPGAAPTPLGAPGGVPGTAPTLPTPSSVPAGAPNVPVASPVTNATTPAVSGAPVGSSGAPGAPGVPGVPGAPEGISPPGTPSTPVSQAPTSVFQKALNAVTKNPLTAGALGLNVVSQLNAQKSGKSLADQLRAVGAPATAASNQLLSQGLSGTPTASAAYDIGQWLKQTQSAIRQRYANMGRDPNNDSAAAKELSDATAKAAAMKDAAAQGLISQGLNAAQVGAGPSTTAALAAAQQDKDLAASIGSTLNSLAMLQALQARNAPAAP